MADVPLEYLKDLSSGFGLYRRAEPHGGFSWWTDDTGVERRVWDDGLDDFLMLVEVAAFARGVPVSVLLRQTDRAFNNGKLTAMADNIPIPEHDPKCDPGPDLHLERWHEAQYKAALRFANHEGPEWSSLTEQQRENIRAVNRQHLRFMQALGDSIKKGGPPPDPFKDLY